MIFDTLLSHSRLFSAATVLAVLLVSVAPQSAAQQPAQADVFPPYKLAALDPAPENTADSSNISEIIGNGAGAGISNAYYPSRERTWTKTGQKWVAQIGLDGESNILKEFWPDMNRIVFRNRY